MPLILPTALSINNLDFSPYSARGITEEWELIDGGLVRRTINAVLVDLVDTAFEKWRITYDCEDLQIPSFMGVRRGQILTVDTINEMSYEVPDPEEDPVGQAASAYRTVVPGSLRTANGFRYFRPRLSMMVRSFEFDREEYPAISNWSLELEEV